MRLNKIYFFSARAKFREFSRRVGKCESEVNNFSFPPGQQAASILAYFTCGECSIMPVCCLLGCRRAGRCGASARGPGRRSGCWPTTCTFACATSGWAWARTLRSSSRCTTPSGPPTSGTYQGCGPNQGSNARDSLSVCSPTASASSSKSPRRASPATSSASTATALFSR